MEYRCKINDRIIFDSESLILPIEKVKVFSDLDLTPIPDKNDNNNLILCRVKFNVISCIFPSASPFEAIEGWRYISQYLQLDEASQLDRMTEFFMIEYLYKLNISSNSMFCYVEPDIIDCVRFAYWYYICLKNDKDNTFQHKKKEIKGKLRRGLLTNLEQFKSSYNYKNNEQIVPYIDKVPADERIKKLLNIYHV